MPTKPHDAPQTPDYAPTSTSSRDTSRLTIKESDYRLTIYASFNGYIAQAVVNNFLPLLFITFTQTFGINFEELSVLIGLNFFLQLLMDAFAGRYVDRIGYKPSMIAAHIFCATGLVLLAFLPFVLPNPFIGIVIPVTLYALGGGLIEVLVSPVVEATPSPNKDQTMSLLHSFYSWGQVGVVLVFVLFISIFGAASWPVLAVLFALIPTVGIAMFARAPMPTVVEEDQRINFVELLKRPAIWFFCLLMIASSAAELAMSQWSSAFAEAGLGVSKVVGDLAGPAAFAVMMGLARIFYAKFGHKIDLRNAIHWSAALGVASFLMAALVPNPVISLIGVALTGLAVGIMAPGLFSLGAQKIPNGGTPMFSLLTFSQDIGGVMGPIAVGTFAGIFGDNLHNGLLIATIFPLIIFLATVRKSVRHRMGTAA